MILRLVVTVCLMLAAFPAHAGLIFSDTFSGTNGTNIQLPRVPDTGDSWTRVLQGTNFEEIGVNGSGFAIEERGPDTAGFVYLTADATYDSADYDIEIQMGTLNPANGAGRMMAMMARYQDNNNFYMAVVASEATTNDVRIYSVVAGVATERGSADTNPVTNDVFIFEIRGNNVALKKNGSYVVGPVAGDAALAETGKAGFGSGDFTGVTTTWSSAGATKPTAYFTVTTVPASTPPRRRTF